MASSLLATIGLVASFIPTSLVSAMDKYPDSCGSLGSTMSGMKYQQYCEVHLLAHTPESVVNAFISSGYPPLAEQKVYPVQRWVVVLENATKKQVTVEDQFGIFSHDPVQIGPCRRFTQKYIAPDIWSEGDFAITLNGEISHSFYFSNVFLPPPEMVLVLSYEERIFDGDCGPQLRPAS